MVAAADRAAWPQPHGWGAHPEHFEKMLEAPLPVPWEQAKHLLKDYATIRGYICGTHGQPSKTQKLAPKAYLPADGAQEEDTKFPEAEQCLMIFGGSQEYPLRCAHAQPLAKELG
jgi:hypothetical protein